MAYGGDLQANTAVDLIVGPFVDEDNGKTAETGLTITQAEVRLSKNGGNMAQKNEATSLTHDELGNYVCKLNTTDTDTEGILTLMIHESGALPIKMDYMVLAQAAYISKYTAKDTGYMDMNIKTITAGIIANASFNADVGSTEHSTNIIALAVRKILEELNLDHLLKVNTTVAADGDLEDYVVAGTVLAHLMSANKDVTGFKCTTDSLEAIKVHADSIKTETALIVEDTGELQTDNYPTSIAAIKTVVDDLDTLTTAAGAGDLAAILADTNEIQGKLPATKFMGSSDGADDDGTLDTINTNAARLTAVRADILTDWINDGRLDAILDAIKVVTDNLASSATTIVSGTVAATAGDTTTIYSDDITEATADHYKGRIIIFTSGDMQNQATDITGYVLDGGEGKFTVTATTETASEGVTFVIV